MAQERLTVQELLNIAMEGWTCVLAEAEGTTRGVVESVQEDRQGIRVLWVPGTVEDYDVRRGMWTPSATEFRGPFFRWCCTVRRHEPWSSLSVHMPYIGQCEILPPNLELVLPSAAQIAASM